ncbi:MAG: NAD(P)-dependent oxidoreductase, partial [Desulfobacterales bacterium]
EMKILITGGSGSLGSYTVPRLIEKGHEIRVFDKRTDIFKGMEGKGLELIDGKVEDRSKVNEAVKVTEVVLHLAWSFSGDPFETFAVDIGGLLNLLDASVQNNVKQFIFVSSAVVYGSPAYTPVDEKHSCEVEDSRKPLYALTKYTAEKLCLVYQKERNLPVTNIRFWWGFGDEIGGKHLRSMIQEALDGEVIQVPQGAGGSFLHFDDFLLGLETILLNEKAMSETFNLSSFYITWEDVAKMIVEVTGSGRVETVSQSDWKGSSFIADEWDLTYKKLGDLLGFSPVYPDDEARKLLKEAINDCTEKILKQ